GADARHPVLGLKLDFLNRKVACVVDTPERAAAADELLERCKVRIGQSIGVLRSQLDSGAATAATPAAAARTTFKRQPCVVREDHHVNFASERRLEIRGVQRDVFEAVLLEHPTRPARVHARVPWLDDAEARSSDRYACGRRG